MQTASIVDFFYPFVTEDSVSAETQLAQIATETHVKSAVDAEIEAELDAELEGESASEAEAETETLGALSCGGDKDCVKNNLNGMTRVHIKDKLLNDVTIEMPEAQKKKITFSSPVLTVVDKDFEVVPATPATPVAPVAPVKPVDPTPAKLADAP